MRRPEDKQSLSEAKTLLFYPQRGSTDVPRLSPGLPIRGRSLAEVVGRAPVVPEVMEVYLFDLRKSSARSGSRDLELRDIVQQARQFEPCRPARPTLPCHVLIDPRTGDRHRPRSRLIRRGEPLDRREVVLLAYPSVGQTRTRAETYRGKSRCEINGRHWCPVAFAPFGPDRTYVLVPSEKPLIQLPA
jgi:hypothetical protein